MPRTIAEQRLLYTVISARPEPSCVARLRLYQHEETRERRNSESCDHVLETRWFRVRPPNTAATSATNLEARCYPWAVEQNSGCDRAGTRMRFRGNWFSTKRAFAAADIPLIQLGRRGAMALPNRYLKSESPVHKAGSMRRFVPITQFSSFFGDPLLASAAIGRLLHDAHVLVLDGDSYRVAAIRIRGSRTRTGRSRGEPTRVRGRTRRRKMKRAQVGA